MRYYEDHRPRRKKIGKALRRDILGANPRCHWCGTDHAPFDIDHLIPVSHGGTNAAGNLVVACYRCNRMRGNTPVKQWTSLMVRKGLVNGLDNKSHLSVAR